MDVPTVAELVAIVGLPQKQLAEFQMENDRLPVYERLGDTRAAAMTWGKVADVLFQRGDYALTWLNLVRTSLSRR